ncbi:MAG TPA: (5-formylfuran-3-yl)methyl phosphate synthase [Methylophilaceae bacterium]|nr:(5-formylfuran-3-yl)methyl phosphate synthase [Methylophilaceae bacterium]
MRIKLLASVTNLDEAQLAVEAGVDIVDLKNPAEGAIGALPHSIVSEIVRALGRSNIFSATIGDLPMVPDRIVYATEQMAQTGVDIVKVGFFGADGHIDCVRALQPVAAKGVRIVAVLFADQEPDLGLIPELQKAGFYGVMLDTAIKDGSSLLDHFSLDDLRHFTQLAQVHGLESGLAGALRLEHIPALACLKPGYMGFRSALCKNAVRVAALSQSRVHELLGLLHKSNSCAPDAASIQLLRPSALQPS